MTSVLILQNEIMAYRKPLYNGLAAFYDVCVVHSGRASVVTGDRYSEVVLSGTRCGPFQIQPTAPLRELVEAHDAVVAMFDLRWPNYLAPMFTANRPRYILWGHWYSTNQLANVARDVLMRQADRLLMYSGEEVERMVKRGIDRRKIVLAPNTIDVPDAKDTSGDPKSSFLFVGRLQGSERRNSKRADLLISSFARTQGRIKDAVVLDIVGDGDELQSLKALAANLGISHKVTFHGHKDDPATLARLFSRAFALVSPGHVGLSVLQSFGHGVPIITGKAVQLRKETQHLSNVATGSDVVMGPEYYNLKHNSNAYLFETEHELDLVLERFCNDHEFTARLGNNAFQYYVTERPLARMLDGFRKAIEE